MRVELDGPGCVASGRCMTAAPEMLDQREDDVRGGVAISPAAAIRMFES